MSELLPFCGKEWIPCVFNEYIGSPPLISGPQVLVYCSQVFPLGAFSSLLGLYPFRQGLFLGPYPSVG
jgi:hypothetical protein